MNPTPTPRVRAWVRRLLKIFFGLCLFWTLVHLVEDWRGKRAWEAWQRDQIAKGAVYEPAGLVGPAVPDDDNFAHAPVIRDLIRRPESRLFPDGFGLMPPKTPAPDWRTGHVMDLKLWEESNQTSDLSTFLSPVTSRLAELNEASLRPASCFDVPRDEGDAHGGLLKLRSAGRVLNLRAILALRSGKPDAALRDVMTELRLVRHLSSDPVLTVQFIQAAMTATAMQGIWEGLETHAWDDAQLTILQKELGQQDQLKPFLVWGKDERVGQFRYWSTVSGHPWWDRKQPLGDNAGQFAASLLVPRGWLYQNQIRADQHVVETWLVAMDPDAHRVFPDRVAAIATWWNHHRSTPYSVFAKHLDFLSDILVAQSQRYAWHQVILDESFIVCALERYRIAHGSYPDSLASLVPAYAEKLPTDVFTGKPLRYQRTEDGGFLLYSVGWDGKDDGGKVVMVPKTDCEPAHQDLTNGDWPWPHMTK